MAAPRIKKLLIPFSYHTSSQFCKARRFVRVAPAIFKYATEKAFSVAYLKMAGATQPKRRALKN